MWMAGSPSSLPSRLALRPAENHKQQIQSQRLLLWGILMAAASYACGAATGARTCQGSWADAGAAHSTRSSVAPQRRKDKAQETKDSPQTCNKYCVASPPRLGWRLGVCARARVWLRWWAGRRSRCQCRGRMRVVTVSAVQRRGKAAATVSGNIEGEVYLPSV